MTTSPTVQGSLWREYRGVLLFLLLMLVFRSAWADWVRVPSGSMNPTILEGDRVLVDKHVFGLRVPLTHLHLTTGTDPERGDIVVFDSPVNGTSLVKRVVAVPGDTVWLDGERLVVNGMVAQYTPGDAARLRTLLAGTQQAEPQLLRESGYGPAHDILLLPGRGALRHFGPVQVPAGQYFMLGDNRDNSADSRYIGFVPRELLIGRAHHILVSADIKGHWRPLFERFGMKI